MSQICQKSRFFENCVSDHTWKDDVEFCAGGVGGDAGSCKGAVGRWGGASGGGIPAAKGPGIVGLTTNSLLSSSFFTKDDAGMNF